MRKLLLVGVVGCLALAMAVPAIGSDPFEATRVGAGPVGDDGKAEIGAFDPGSGRFFAVDNSGAGVLDVYEVGVDGSLSLIETWTLGGSPNSVDAYDGVVAVAVESADKATIPGSVEFYDAAAGTPLATVEVGFLPDMLTYTPDGRYVVVANEGEPNADYTADPPGSVSIIDTRDWSEDEATFDRFSKQWLERRGVRFGRGDSVAQDLEPEYVAISPNGRRAYVTLQENNAIAAVDIRRARVLWIAALGTKDMTRDFYDFTNEDGGIDPIRLDDVAPDVELRGLYMPDALAIAPVGRAPFLVTANEGDAREYPEDDGGAFLDTDRVRGFYQDGENPPVPADEQCTSDLEDWCVTLDGELFTAAYDLVIGGDGERLGDTDEDVLGRLNVSLIDGDVDGDGDIDELHSLGGRSMSIWSAGGRLLWDSRDLFTEVTIDRGLYVDGRSDDKGSEPESVVVGRIGHRNYAFVGLERTSGIVVFDVTRPTRPVHVGFIDPEVGGADLGEPDDYEFASPEGLEFVGAADSPTGEPLLFVSHEGADDNAGVVVYELAP